MWRRENLKSYITYMDCGFKELTSNHVVATTCSACAKNCAREIPCRARNPCPGHYMATTYNYGDK
jgi:hypothetical protein